MPSYLVYALAENFPCELRYADAVCKLELTRGGVDGKWVLRARKCLPPTFCEITSSRFGLRALQTTLRSGFVVEEGSTAAKLLDRMVHERFATSATPIAATCTDCAAVSEAWIWEIPRWYKVRYFATVWDRASG
jgi:hypothetical protein